MPIKYTMEQVTEIFEKNNCKLISETYKNQVDNLNYVASCGHTNIIKLKAFLIGHGIKCRNCALEIPTYEMINKIFEDKNCTFCCTKEEFDSYYINCKQKLKYIASCGHENNISLKNFNGLNQGTNCPLCVNKNTGIKLKELRSGENTLGALKQELSGINYFKDLIQDSFVAIKAFDGCKSDVIIKPKTCDDDLWLGIQVKTTHKKTERSQYYFRLNNGKYENCILLCICEEDKKIWLIPYKEVEGLKTIGIALKSKYNKFEVNNENLFEKLNNYYESCNKLSFTVLDTPVSNPCKQEQQYRKNRETKIDFIEFTNNGMEGLVYDFMIGTKKVQEKVGTITHDNPNAFSFNLHKYACRINGKSITKCYQKRDNDLYWLNCKNDLFYVIPENILIEKGFIGENCKRLLYVSPTNKNTEWCNDYLFDYNNIDKERLLTIIN